MDWIQDNDDPNSFRWISDATSPETTPDGYTYIGQTVNFIDDDGNVFYGAQDGQIYNSTPLPDVNITADMPDYLQNMYAAHYLGIYQAQNNFLNHPITQATVGIMTGFINPSFFASRALVSTTAANAAKSTLSATTKLTKEGLKYTKSNLKLGQQMHKAYHAGEFGKEFRLPSGRRIDFLDINNQIIYELKPYNPRAIRQGQKQLQIYLKELQSMPRFQGYQWQTVIEFY